MWWHLPLSSPLTRRLSHLRNRLAPGYPPSDQDPALIWAAVAIILTPDPEAILLIRRAERIGDPWSGHMALPGGRREPAEEDLLATAIRETYEEVGIELHRAHLAGRLDDVVPQTPVLPPIAVRPFVFIPPNRPTIELNPEVASARWVALDDLLRPGAHGAVRLEIGGQSREVEAYRLEDAIVWGMTERILNGLLQHLGD